jgi:hypothetical protein
MSQLTKTLSHYWAKIQRSLFPCLEEELDPLTEKTAFVKDANF